MNWRKWKIGLVVAVVSGALSGVLGLAVGMTKQQVWLLVGINAAKDALLYLKQNPVSQISFETERLTKTASGDVISEIQKQTIIKVDEKPPTTPGPSAS